MATVSIVTVSIVTVSIVTVSIVTVSIVTVSMASWAHHSLLRMVAFDGTLEPFQRVRPELVEQLAHR